MTNMPMLIFVSEIGTSKSKNQSFHVILVNKDISITTLDTTVTFSMTALHIHSEGVMSHFRHLGPRFYFM